MRNRFNSKAIMMILLALAMSGSITSGANAADRYVSTTGSDTLNNCLDPNNPCATIFQAHDQASSEDVIHLGQGVYAQNTTLEKSITILGAGADQTSIDGGNNIVFRVNGTNITFEGLRIFNGSGAAGGAILIQQGSGVIRITDCLLDSNFGDNAGAISIPPTANVTITGTTITNNEVSESFAGDGGGIENFGVLAIINSTISGNRAVEGLGGGVHNVGTLTVINSTIAGNTATSGGGGGIRNSGTVTLTNTIVANNNGNDCSSFSAIGDGGNNFTGDGTCGIGQTGDPMLATLADNGGTTPTLALMPGSPAIDAGNNTVCADGTTVNNLDQRGETRPVDGNDDSVATCDIGAFEAPVGSVLPPEEFNCPKNKRFWSRNPSAWPVVLLTLGDEQYIQAELLNLFSIRGKDSSVKLAQELIAAKLNIANDSFPTPIAPTIQEADNLLSTHDGKLPYFVDRRSVEGQQMISLTRTLSDYNKGNLTPVCIE